MIENKATVLVQRATHPTGDLRLCVPEDSWNHAGIVLSELSPKVLILLDFLATGGPWALVGIAVWMIYTGRLVPKRFYEHALAGAHSKGRRKGRRRGKGG